MKLSIGSNNATSREGYLERYAYARNYPPGIRDYRKIDFWYNEMLFGRVDYDGEAIYPSEAFLKQLAGEAKESYFVLNFVADAYRGFRETMKAQEGQRHFIHLEGTPFESHFQPTNGWKSINQAHSSYIQNYYNSYLLPFLAEPSRKDEILNFDDFVEAFAQMIDTTSLTAPLTKTQYISSKQASPLSSGLMVEFQRGGHGEDAPKINDFINNINFELYREMASKHGFAVDVNAPWRLVADVGSDAMQRYMSNHNISLGSLFGEYYYKACFFDIPSLKVYLFDFYQYFLNAFPNIRAPVVGEVEGGTINLTTVEKRAMMSVAEYESKYDNLFWIRFYLYVRGKETNQDWDQHDFDHRSQRASDFLIYSGEEVAMKYINKEVFIPVNQYARGVKKRKGSFRLKRKRE